MGERRIVAIGGLGSLREEMEAAIRRYLLGLVDSPRPRVCFVATATGDDPSAVVRFYEQFAGLAEASHLPVFPWPPENLRELVLNQDLIYVSGGNTANMLALWRVHGIDVLLREAWESGTVMAGWSAGMLCWFEAGVTDSFGPRLEGMRDGLGFLSGSACPHYDGEELRRPRYHELVSAGFPAGLAADDGVGLHFQGTDLVEVVSARRGARAYRVELADGEVREARLEARSLE